MEEWSVSPDAFMCLRPLNQSPGAPVYLAPNQDDQSLGADKTKNNNFDFTLKDDAQSGLKADRCPFSCHIRKMVPRGDLQLDQQQRHRILRRSIQFGPELSDEEKAQNKTLQDRGLYFACYQSNLQNGYHFIQKCRSPLVFPLCEEKAY